MFIKKCLKKLKMPTPYNGNVSRSLCIGPGLRTLVAALSFLVFQPTHAQPAAADPVQAGLNTLLKRPWDHELRFAVAERLIKAGRIDEAVMQLEVLNGTSLSYIAGERLQQIRRTAEPAAAIKPVQVADTYTPTTPAALVPAPAVPLPAPARAIGQNNSAIEIRQLPQFQYLAPGALPEPNREVTTGKEATGAKAAR
jgi:hypothetical protein